MEVQLESYEIELAASVAIKRKVDSIFNKRKVLKKRTSEDWGNEIEAAAAEMAVAKALNKYYGFHYNTFKTIPDVGGYEVRSSQNDSANLIVRPRDSGESIFILVTGTVPNYTLRGWKKGSDVMVKKYFKNPGGLGAAFFLPQEELNSMETLPK